MKNHFLFILFVCCSACVPAQNLDLDSLKEAFNPQIADTNTLNTLFAITGTHYLRVEDDSVQNYNQQLIDLSHQLASIKYLGRAYEIRGGLRFEQAAYEEAHFYCDSALWYYHKIGQQDREMTTHHLKAIIYLRQGKLEESLQSYNDSYRIAEIRKDTLTMAINLTGQAGIQISLTNYDQSESYYLEAIGLLKGSDYRSQLRRGMAYMNLGNLYVELAQYEKASAVEEKAIQIFEEIGNRKFEIAVKGNHATTLMELGRYEEAIPPMKERVAYNKELGPFEYQLALGALGRAYRQMGNYAEAEPLLKESLKIARELDAREEESTHLAQLSKLYAAKGEYKKAYQLLFEQQDVKDSLFNKNSAEALQEITQELETEKKEAAIARLELENNLKESRLQNSRYTQVGLVGAILLLTLVGFFAWFTQMRKLQNERLIARKNQELHAETFNKNKIDLELKALRSQMNPHFIFNSMNSVNRLILEGKNEQAALNLSKFAKLVRMILEYSEKEKISLQEELDLLQTYIQLESRRFKDKLSVDMEVSAEIDPEEIRVPSMLLQPFVENAIWHGLMHKKEGEGKISIRIDEFENYLKCAIEDNGVGREKAQEMKEKTVNKQTSMAMKVTEARLKLLSPSNIKEKLIHILDLKNANNQPIGTRVEVSIPL